MNLHKLSNEIKKELLKISTVTYFAKDENFENNKPEYCYFLIEGIVKTYYCDDNESEHFLYFNTLEYVLIQQIFLEKNFNYKFTAITNGKLITTPITELFQLSCKYVELDKLIILSNQEKHRLIIKRIRSIMVDSIENRLLKYLKTISNILEDKELYLPLNTIAKDLNYSRETISRGLKKLEEMNELIKKNRSILLLKNNTY
jgi:CRP-like cAMP-binding protein